MQQIVLIPTLNPSVALLDLAAELMARDFSQILVVDDGNDASCNHIFEALEHAGCTVVHHEVNHGKGAAIKTGIGYARELWPEASHIITFDGDGQHLPADVARVATEACAHPHALVLGVRDFGEKDVPWKSRAGNVISARYFRQATGVRVDDTQTGLRAIPASLFDAALATPGERYDWEMNFLMDAARSSELWLVPISTVYLNGNAESHFNPVPGKRTRLTRTARTALALYCTALIGFSGYALLDAFVIPHELESAGLTAADLAASADASNEAQVKASAESSEQAAETTVETATEAPSMHGHHRKRSSSSEDSGTVSSTTPATPAAPLRTTSTAAARPPCGSTAG